MADITRIIDLPENTPNPQSQMQMQNPPQIRNIPSFGNSYTPMDIHPNPYGHPPPSVPTIPKPSETVDSLYPQYPQQRLPSRDIPMDQSIYTQDAQIQSNYIPPIPESVKKTTEYVKRYEEATEKRIQNHEYEKIKQSRLDAIIEEYQIPMLIAVLFFVFHMPMVDKYIFKYMSFLSLHDLDGHFNVYGAVFKSTLFAGVYLMVTKLINLLSEI